MHREHQTRMKRINVLVATGLLLAASGAVAAPIEFFGEDTSTSGTLGPNSADAREDFLANLSGVGNEDFESFNDGDEAPLNLSFPGSSGTLGADLTGEGEIDDDVGVGRFATSGSNYWEASTGSFVIDFTDPVNAFGFNGIDIGDFVSEQMVLNITDADGNESAMTVPHSLGIGNYDQSTLFYGLIDPDQSFSQIEFTNAGGVEEDLFAFDDMVIGDAGQINPNPTPNPNPSPVPEPASLVLLALGLLGIRSGRRFS